MITWYFLLKFNTTSKCAAASQGFHKICLNTALDLCSEHHRQFLISSYNLDSPRFYQGSFRGFPVDHLPGGCTEDQLSKSSIYSRNQWTDTCVLCMCIEGWSTGAREGGTELKRRGVRSEYWRAGRNERRGRDRAFELLECPKCSFLQIFHNALVILFHCDWLYVYVFK